jgi:hypothetical protein
MYLLVAVCCDLLSLSFLLWAHLDFWSYAGILGAALLGIVLSARVLRLGLQEY